MDFEGDNRILPSQIPSESTDFGRRRVLSVLTATAVASGLAPLSEPAIAQAARATKPGTAVPPVPPFARNARWSVREAPNTWDEITTYNNFYEFGLDKTDPMENAQGLRTRPWSVDIAGEAEVTGKFTLEDILKPHALEERVYRFRCVEGWSRIVPWLGFPLGDLIKRFRPTSRAKFVELTTLLDPRQMPGQRTGVLDWPYVEALRIDEAMHPLTLVVGLYGRWLPNQSGAPLRLIVPWKYGFKSVKSIVRIRFTERQPRTSWNIAAPEEYGFFANVNPAVDHPRWSQAKERRIGAGLFAPRIDTLPFNGYAAEVAGLYRGLDLRRFY
jgi:sulfoxide reductase catalytic subunit YedY